MITVNNKLCIAIAAVATLITGAALAHAEMSGNPPGLLGVAFLPSVMALAVAVLASLPRGEGDFDHARYHRNTMRRYNPATGLPMHGGVDAAGNPYGSRRL